MKKITSFLVLLQSLCILLFLFSGRLVAKNPVLLVIELLSVALMIWDILLMIKKSRIRVRPEPAADARLLESGPYKYIRNPMYSGGLLIIGVLVLDSFTVLRLTLFVLLAVVLLKKISIEEKLLMEKFPGYAAYKSRTRRLIPFIY